MNLIIQPEAGLSPVVRAIQKAKHTVDIAIFRTDREEIEKALGAAVQRGVKVRVLVAHTNKGGETRLRKLEQRLLEAGATVARTGDDFIRYHGKFMVADDTLASVRLQFHRHRHAQEPQLRRVNEGRERRPRGTRAVRRRQQPATVRSQADASGREPGERARNAHGVRQRRQAPAPDLRRQHPGPGLHEAAGAAGGGGHRGARDRQVQGGQGHRCPAAALHAAARARHGA